MLLRVVHETRYRYTPAVETAHHVLVLRPANTSTQTVHDFALDIDPPPGTRRDGADVFGNARTYVSLQSPHGRLRVVATSTIETKADASARNDREGDARESTPWEQVRDRFRYRAGADYDRAAEFLFASPYAPRDEAFEQFARPSFPPARPLLQAAHDLMMRIHEAVQYESESTEVGTPALDALMQGKGVCQDFAHIMVACCRAMGLPARYVSGYLLTRPPPGMPRLVGSDASHAWASVYLPGLQSGAGHWFDFDPTNNRAPGEDYVTLAIGRDFLDVSPLRGVIRGGARHVLEVAVTVEPIHKPDGSAR
jgi:transglutaminase-like putative cysteine protease